MTGSLRTAAGLAATGALLAVLLGGSMPAPPAAAPGRLCVLRTLVAGPTVRDDGLLYFRGQPDPGKSYIAAFKGSACAKLNPLALISLESGGNRVCEGDKVRTSMSPGQVPGPVCIIDRLLPFSGGVDDPLPRGWPH